MKIMFKYLSCVIVFLIMLVVLQGADTVEFSRCDQKTESDVIIVLGAAAYNEQVSPVYKERINHAIKLYNEGYAKSIIFTGGISDGEKVSDAFAAKMYAINSGVSPKEIFIEESSTITEENFYFAKQIMLKEGFDSAIIVSDPLHMKRAMLMARDYDVSAVSSPTETSMYKSLGTKLPFLLRELFFFNGYCVVRIFR